MKQLLIALALFVAPYSAYGQGFGDAASDLEQRVLTLEQQMLDVLQRLEDLEPSKLPPVVGVEPGQDPFAQHRIPGYIQAEDYDLGGNGVAYSDQDAANRGGAYRADWVDIKEISIDEFAVGWTNEQTAMEWLEYTVGAEAGTYDVHFRVASASPQPGPVLITLDGESITPLVVPSTGDWDDYQIVVLHDVVVSRTGNMILRLEFPGEARDLDYIRFVAPGTAFNNPPTDILLCPPDYDGDLSLCS